MRGLYFHETLRYITDLPEPKLQPGEALVKVLYAGICNTDKEILKGYLNFRGVPGHEFVGRVCAPGDSPLLGERVVGEINCGCGKCRLCSEGNQRHCPDRTVLGIAGRNGAFAEYLSLPEINLHKVPERVSDLEAVFVEPLAAACRICEQVKDLPERVLVVGDGKLGLLIAQVLSLSCQVCLLGHHPERARRLLGERVEVRGDADGLGSFKMVVEASGRKEGLEVAFGCVEPEGVVVLKSTYVERPAFDFSRELVVPEVTLLGSRCGPFSHAISLLERREVSVEGLVEEVFELERWQEAFSKAFESGSLKVLLRLNS